MGASLRVLLVEDSEDDALLLLRELRRGGYDAVCERVDTASAMEAALDKGEWDVVISDHSMPAFSSSAALELLRSRGYPDLPFIIVSGKIGESAAVEAMKAGAQDYIMKDNLARLNTAIERELREAEVRRERRSAEEARRLAEEKYRSIFENAVEGIFQTTVDGRLVTANPALARMFGYDSPAQLLAEIASVRDQLYVAPVSREEFEHLMRRDGYVSGFETQMRRRDGSAMWASLSARAVRDERGGILGYEGTIEDVTARRRAEEQLKEIREAERRRIARELHDGVLQDLTYALQSLQISGRLPEAARLGETQRQIEALRRSVGGLRDAIYELRLEGARERPLLKSLESLVELNRQLAPDTSFELVAGVEVPDVLSGAGGLEVARIVQEALANVRRHSGASHAEVRVSLSGATLRIEISDDGRGFGPGERPGMGLTGMKERAAALGGALDVEGRPGEGARVILRVAVSALEEGDGGLQSA